MPVTALWARSAERQFMGCKEGGKWGTNHCLPYGARPPFPGPGWREDEVPGEGVRLGGAHASISLVKDVDGGLVSGVMKTGVWRGYPN